ncbi:multiple sugar transport system permease protein [Rhizobium azooxidifex]|uniref:Multiple sugar transport system permease protein n=1 Tax=Mycoplana azooxidifex TaxID=1636188 RepID=A0A7W6D9U8_9HYPH|nr:carbohydrate ABC transporter permease [Mycoplana azooxidifex]MBB3976677.1 multiple sugar transport system permease protein [Mycoplana azooxidifex]
MLELRGRSLLLGRALLALSVVFTLAPFLYILATSFKTEIAIATGDVLFDPTLGNYQQVLFGRRSNFVRNLFNSVTVAAVSTAITLTIGLLAAYTLERQQHSRLVSRVFLGWTLVFHVMPTLTLIGPWYLIFRWLDLYNTLTALVLVHVVLNLPLTVWLLMGFIRDIPVELEDAARVDGCTPFQVFRKVVLPLVTPGLIAAGVLAFVFSWNEFSVALTLASRAAATVPIGIAQFAQQFEIQNGPMAAASMIAILPALVLMIFGQRFVVQGLTGGALK